METKAKTQRYQNRSSSKVLIRITLTALFAAITAAGAFIAIPIGPVPIALQNLFTLLAGLVMGPVLGALSVGLFLVAGAIGLPVFANTGAPMGIARIMGPTGGYLFGYLLGALVAGLILGYPRAAEKIPIWRLVIAVLAALLVVYIPGLLQLKFRLDIDWARTFSIGFLPFIPGDAIKGLVAALAAPRLRRIASQRLA